jgi:DNA-binding XRE family transcriptional regulator
MTDLEYVTDKLKSEIFNVTQVAKKTEVSRSTLNKIMRGEKVREYVITALAVFFRKSGD